MYSPDGVRWTSQQLPEHVGPVDAFAGHSILVGRTGVYVQADHGEWIGR